MKRYLNNKLNFSIFLVSLCVGRWSLIERMLFYAFKFSIQMDEWDSKIQTWAFFNERKMEILC
jgi:hypothetical protein